MPMKAKAATMMPRKSRLVAEFRDRLAVARLNLARTVALTDSDLETLAAHESREIAEDRATGTVGELLGRLGGAARAELDAIDAAQARLEGGVFGACEACGRSISVKRLRQAPTARHCDSCRATRASDY
jgi:DnaK suppressor protein